MNWLELVTTEKGRQKIEDKFLVSWNPGQKNPQQHTHRGPMWGQHGHPYGAHIGSPVRSQQLLFTGAKLVPRGLPTLDPCVFHMGWQRRMLIITNVRGGSHRRIQRGRGSLRLTPAIAETAQRWRMVFNTVPRSNTAIPRTKPQQWRFFPISSRSYGIVVHKAFLRDYGILSEGQGRNANTKIKRAPLTYLLYCSKMRSIWAIFDYHH